MELADVYLTSWKLLGLLSHMETKSDRPGGTDDSVDPLSHLALLDRSTRAPEWEAFLNFGPWWYPPLFATFIGSLALYGVSSAQNWFLVATFVTGTVISVHAFRNREVRPKPTTLGFVLTMVATLTLIAAISAWNMVAHSVGYEDFWFEWALAAWILTTGFFAGIRSLLLRVRSGRRVATA